MPGRLFSAIRSVRNHPLAAVRGLKPQTQFIIEELARLFNVPPRIIGDLQYGTFSNVETLMRRFAQNTLSPWIRQIESEFSRNIFGASRDTHRLELDLSGLMRGDPTQRWQAWDIAVRNNILIADEVRQEEGWNPRPAR